MAHINDLPDELLEFIISFLPPYRDLEECMKVSRRWSNIVKNVTKFSITNFENSLSNFRICWNFLNPVEMSPTIAGRFSHSAIVHQNSMFIFGGCSSTTTTFNDLWRFDLSKRQWIRPFAIGAYPSPKASASMVCYKDSLILYGGWRHPPTYPSFQARRMFDELHVFNITNNQWVAHQSYLGPPPMSGHSASVHNDVMVVFGGYQVQERVAVYGSNDVWCLDLKSFKWSTPSILGEKPPPRYGQYQVALNNFKLFVLGGCGGPNNLLSDAWILDMTEAVWKWEMVTVKNRKWSPTNMWCNPACKVGNKIVFLGPTASSTPDFQLVKDTVPIARNYNSRDEYALPRKLENIYGGHLTAKSSANGIIKSESQEKYNSAIIPNKKFITSTLKSDNPNADNNLEKCYNMNRIHDGKHRCKQMEKHNFPTRFDFEYQPQLGMAAFKSADESSLNDQPRRRLDHLKRIEEKLKSMHVPASIVIDKKETLKRKKKNCLAMFVCNIENILITKTIEWIHYTNYGILSGAPESLILSSMVSGNGELIIFGGLRKESLNNLNVHVQVSNSLYLLKIPRNII